jgi:hypothetical protein
MLVSKCKIGLLHESFSAVQKIDIELFSIMVTFGL